MPVAPPAVGTVLQAACAPLAVAAGPWTSSDAVQLAWRFSLVLRDVRGREHGVGRLKGLLHCTR